MSNLRICIVGGIFDKPEDYRSRHRFTPETILSEGLRSLGFEVQAFGHRDFVPSEDYDLVHVHHLGRAALIMATANTRSFFVYTGHDGRALCGYRPSLRRKLASRLVISRTDTVVALSDVERKHLQQSFGKYGPEIVVISNGVPNDVFHYEERDIVQNGTYRILFVGQLIALKGLDVLLKAFQIVSASKEVELLVVYQTSPLERHYKHMVCELGIANRVHFLGFKSAYELSEIYRGVDLFVLPSFAEALPSTIAEAMLSGIPVIATDVGGIREQVGEYGIVVKPGNVQELVDVMNQALDNISGLRSRAKEMSKYAKEKFSVEVMVRKHLRLYEKLLQRKGHLRRNNRHYWFPNTVIRTILEVVW